MASDGLFFRVYVVFWLFSLNPEMLLIDLKIKSN